MRRAYHESGYITSFINIIETCSGSCVNDSKSYRLWFDLVSTVMLVQYLKVRQKLTRVKHVEFPYPNHK
jgi:hypothetical protein